MEYILKLDYDTHCINGIFAKAVWQVKHVYRYKREYLPKMRVMCCMRTKKGYHVMLVFMDKEKFTPREARLSLLLLQTCFGSDSVRSLFDLLRIANDEHAYNMLFDYKNAFECKDDRAMLIKLNASLINAGVFDGKG